MTKYHISMLTNKNVIGKQILDYIRQESGIVKLLHSLLALISSATIFSLNVFTRLFSDITTIEIHQWIIWDWSCTWNMYKYVQ